MPTAARSRSTPAAVPLRGVGDVGRCGGGPPCQAGGRCCADGGAIGGAGGGALGPTPGGGPAPVAHGDGAFHEARTSGTSEASLAAAPAAVGAAPVGAGVAAPVVVGAAPGGAGVDGAQAAGRCGGAVEVSVPNSTGGGGMGDEGTKSAEPLGCGGGGGGGGGVGDDVGSGSPTGSAGVRGTDPPDGEAAGPACTVVGDPEPVGCGATSVGEVEPAGRPSSAGPTALPQAEQNRAPGVGTAPQVEQVGSVNVCLRPVRGPAPGGGGDRIRTGVQGFAGLCLTTRPRRRDVTR